jgi:hypothetical protein
MGQQEVKCAAGRDADSLWVVSYVHARDARFVAQSVPSTLLLPGQGQDVSVTMRNVGTETWTPQRQHRLGSQNPQDNQRWGLGRVEVPGPVPPGQEATFRFHLTAPGTTGRHGFQWRMLREGVEWFGEYTPPIVIGVFQTPTTVPDVLGMPRALAGNDIRAAGLVPRFTGAQGVLTEVSSQSPPASTTVDRGTVITLHMSALN